MSEIKFPQPLTKPIEQCLSYWCVDNGEVVSDLFPGHPKFEKLMRLGLVYESAESANQRLAWEAKENAKRIMPQWYRDLGPDVEWFNGISWYPAGNNAGYNSPPDWSSLDRSHYRAKPKQIVRVIDGVEYRWAPTLAPGTIHKQAYFPSCQYKQGVTAFRPEKLLHCLGGDRTHAKFEDCQAQCAALNAVLGVSDA